MNSLHKVKAIRYLRTTVAAAAVLTGSPVLAQDGAPPPPARPVFDDKSVDLTTGYLITSVTDITIGPSDHRGLQYVRQWVPAQWRQAIVPVITGSSDTPTVTYNGQAYSFTASFDGTSFNPDIANGTTLSFDRTTFTAADGTVITFATDGYALFDTQSNLGRGTSIVFPDGTKRIFDYQLGTATSGSTMRVARLSSVTSSAGYQLKLSYDSNSLTNFSSRIAWSKVSRVTAINNAVEYCNPTSISCSLSNSWPYVSYSNSGAQISAITDQEGRSLNYYYNSIGLISAVRMAGSTVNSVEVIYYPNTSWVQYLKNFGQTWTYAFQIGTQWTTSAVVTDPSSHTRSMAFDPFQYTRSMTDENSNTITYQYCNYTNATGCPVGLLQKIILPEGDSTEYKYDARGNVIETLLTPKSGSGNIAFISSSATYPSACPNRKTCNKPVTVTDARGQITNYEYDGNSGIVSKITMPASGAVRPEVRTTFTDLQAWIKDASGAIVLAPSATRYVTGISTCAIGSAPTCVGTADETLTEFTYEGKTTTRGTNVLLAAVTTRAGNNAAGQTRTVTRTYDDIGNVVSLSDGLGNVGQKRYNAARQETSSWAADPDAGGPLNSRGVLTHYGANALPDVVTRGTINYDGSNFTAFDSSSYSYDSYGRPIRELVQQGGTQYSVTQIRYDAVGRKDCIAVRMNPAVFGSLPTSACSLGTTGSDGPDRITKNEYDAAGQLTKVIRAYGVTTGNGFPVTLQQDYATYTYSPNGKQKTVVDANGNRAELFYDGFDRQIAWAFPSKANGASTASCTLSGISETNGISGPTEARSASDDCEKYAYDRNGNRAKLMKRDGQVIRYSYDALNRMTLKDLPSGSDVYYGYDLRGLQTYARFGLPNGEGISNGYDGLGRLTSSTNNMGGVSRKLSYEYDGNGNRTKIVFPDEQTDVNGNVTVARHFNYDYDSLDRLIRIRENDATEIASISYNSRGERTDIGGGFNTHFDYDGISRLARITHNMTSAGQAVTFCMGTMSGETCNPSYNAAGQILNRTITNSGYLFNNYWNFVRTHEVNGLNQYTSVSGKERKYDDNGNMTYDAGSDKTGPVTYTYDVENRLTGASGADNVTLSYDPLGRLYQTVDASRSAPGNTTRFLYDGDELVAEYDGNNEMVHRYVHGSGTDDPLVWYMGSGLGSRRHLRTDHQGSIVAISNGAGNSIAINSYDEYGVAGLRNFGRFGYTGQIIIPELGLNYYKARIYSPTLGRFLQTDPIGYDDQINLYAYVANDPVNGVDPTGQSCFNITDGSAAENQNNDCAVADEITVEGSKPEENEGRQPVGLLPDPIIRLPGIDGSPQNTNGCTPNNQSFLGSVASVADAVALGADAVTVGAGAVAVATGPSVVGGIAGGTVAAGARFVSGAASFVSAGAKFGNGDWIGGSASVVGILAGGAATRATESFLARQFAKQNFGASVRQGIAAAYAKDLAGSQAGKQVERGVSVICP